MRGKVPAGFLEVVQPRITPAYAGKSVISGSLWLSSRDHPRVCGEKWVPVVSSVSVQGSPPRMRGKVMQQCVARKVVGITPAYAGKSRPSGFRGSVPWDHPRVCGEKCWPLVCMIWLMGSPPRMRGKAIAFSSMEHSFRITPAYAGKSITARCPEPGTWDHPRVCGEKEK